MTQAQLRAFIPLMLKYSTGRGKPGWGREDTKPPWWPKEVPWANVRMDARDMKEKQKVFSLILESFVDLQCPIAIHFQVSWTLALREIVLNCYRYHGREDLLPQFNDDEETKETREKITQKLIKTEDGEVVSYSYTRIVQRNLTLNCYSI
jgi:nuclear respiratory factor 1